jgi:ankyrin repeat protein
MVYPPSIFGPPAYAETSHPCQYLEMERRLNQSESRIKSCIIHPTEILFLPEKWPHSTCNLDSYTVGVGYFGALGNMSALEQAAVRGAWPEVQAALPTSSDTLRSLLELAAEAGHGVVTQGLLSRGAEATGMDLKGRSALHAAAKTGWPETVSLLLQARAAPDEKDVDGNLPLLEATYAGHLGVVQTLCRCEASTGAETRGPCRAAKACATTSTKCKGCKYETVLEAAASGGHLSVTNFLFNEGGLHEQVDVHDLDAPLVRAASGGHVALVDFLFKSRADVNTRTREGKPPIMWSAKYGHQSAIEKLMQHGANVSLGSLDGSSALVEAIRRRKDGVVKYLIEHGMLTDVQDQQHRTPIFHAATRGQTKTMDLLLNARATIDVEDVYGTNAIDEAARMDQSEAVLKLLTASGKHARALASKALRFLDSAHNVRSLGGGASSGVRQILKRALDDTEEL